jgi:hypothetical protein
MQYRGNRVGGYGVGRPGTLHLSYYYYDDYDDATSVSYRKSFGLYNTICAPNRFSISSSRVLSVVSLVPCAERLLFACTVHMLYTFCNFFFFFFSDRLPLTPFDGAGGCRRKTRVVDMNV